ncbi:MAG: aminopeptidase P N-terminal domain-containing protein [Acidobacteria bacterium]|nr:aminopeptidase P N-terminal domain-containing protein [Acidobacteriota bacterium]
MRITRVLAAALSMLAAFSSASALEKQSAAEYHARRVALGNALHGGVAILFAAEEPVLDFDPYRQDSDFYYLTGWNEPGAALLIVGPTSETEHAAQPAHRREYKEVLFLPTRNLRTEQYTGAKMDATTPGVAHATGVDNVEQMTNLAVDLNKLIGDDRRLAMNIWTQPRAKAADSVLDFTAATLGTTATSAKDVTTLTMPLREVKDAGEIELLKKASTASIAGQRAMMKAVKPGETERTVAGIMTAAWYKEGCERPSYAPIVGTGLNSTTLHYSENSGTIRDGDVVVVDAACEYSMYASDITRTVPANGHFTARQREIYDIVLGAQKAAMDAFVVGKSKINDFSHRDPDTLDAVAFNYINTHGKDLHGHPLGKYWLHGLGHMVGIDVHDPAQYPAVLKPGMVFTIEPGVYIPEEKLGVRIECDFLVLPDGKLLDLNADLPHTADEVEAEMKN